MKYISSLMTVSTFILIAGCSGGSQSTSGSSSGLIMSGVAATGAPISAGKVEVKGANGVIVEDTTNSDGSYQADVSTLTEPYLIRVIAPSGEKYISVASKSALAEGKKINVTPLTHIIVANVFNNASADDVFSNFETNSSDFTEQKLEDEKDELLQKFVSAGLVGNGKIASADIDLLNGNLAAGTSQGVDGLLDVIQVNTDASAGIEIKLKGAATAMITDKVDAVDPVVVAISQAEFDAAEAQLDVIGQLRIRMNALAALHSSKVSCNGAPKDDGSACDIDTLYNTFLPYFHADFQEEGLNRAAGVWGWFCRVGDNDEEATTKTQCLTSGSILFENVALKDITLISYDDTTKVALISFNFYLDGVLKGSEEMYLKLDTGDNIYKLLGSKKTFKYWIDTESLFSTTYDKSNNSTGYQGVSAYSVNLNFYYKNSGSYTFNGSETFTLTATSGHQIFPGNSATMSLYLIVGPDYSNANSCTTGLVFSTTQNPYKIFNQQNGQTTYADYATACAYTNDPCNCRPDANSNAYFDHDVAQKVAMPVTQVVLMDKIENISLTGSGVTADAFSIKKPLVVNEFNAAKHIPSFGMTVASFCKDINFSTPLNLSTQSGTLNYISLHHGFSDANNSAWKSKSDSVNYWDSNLTSTTYTPNFSGVLSTDVIRNSHLYLSAHDEFERQFVRRVNCNGN